MSSTLEHDPRVVAERRGIAGFFADYRQRLRQGDIGQLPVIVGLIAIWSIFYVASNGVFLSPFNLVNLTLQMAAVGSISVGIVLILLLGDIDLSAGVVSGMCAAVMAVLSVQHDVSPQLAVGIALLVGAAVGTLHGVWITRFGIPAFVVTLAGLIAWQGLLLRVLGRTGTINLKDPFITGLAGTFYTGPTAYLLGAAFLAYVAVRPILENRRRRAAGLSVPPATVVWVRALGFTALVLLAVWYLCKDRGISSGLFYLVSLVVVMDLILRRTRLGRMIYAIGGNAEAARRAGLPVRRIRTLVFALASMLAAWGGILGASRLLAVNQSAGQGDILLNAIAAAVIGGTSLFGGRGSVWAALLGIIVIQSISNGMDLLSLQPSIKFMITGAVLLTAVTLDAVLRRGRTPGGR
ncbi:MAG: sugar ABC transporter permease [Myxococcales bacterium]|nr:sugar ABC transporter permease [Myxococcales bacterium]